jgi:Flp pilus assembly protein TadB
MAQTKRKRRTKHRGTQAGTIESRGRTSRPTSRADARKQAMQRKQTGRVERANRPPSWRNAAIRAGAAAAIFLVILVIMKQPPVSALFVAALMFGLYIPMGFYTDKFLYDRRNRKDAEARAKSADERLAKKAANGTAASADTAGAEKAIEE